MKILRTRKELQGWRKNNPSPSFIPTMGALHEGHLSLVSAACSPKIVSLFVNPKQFSPEEDLKAYPRTFTEDAQKLREAGVDALFFPSEEEVYGGEDCPKLFEQNTEKLPEIFQTLEGAERPTHFRGVAEVLFQFFSLISPSRVFFGQKDFQQTVLVRWLLAHYFPNTEPVVCPIVREENGLALSSRNRYLSDQQRTKAVFLFETLQWAQKIFLKKTPSELMKNIQERLQDFPLFSQVDYICVADAKTLQTVDSWKGDSPLILLVAVRVGKVRLLDNILLR